MQKNAVTPQSSTSTTTTGKQVVELNGYVIILVEDRNGKIKLYGSPADKDGLEVADEILDVNERKLEDLPRAEVIRHIHECIQSCMIKLRVKRRSDSRLAGELGNAVQDAFVIAVEQQARDRLQRLSALKRIQPVDISQLSIKLNQQTKGTVQDFSFLKEASPIYVTSFGGNAAAPDDNQQPQKSLTSQRSSGDQPVTAADINQNNIVKKPPGLTTSGVVLGNSSSSNKENTVNALNTATTASTTTTLNNNTSININNNNNSVNFNNNNINTNNNNIYGGNINNNPPSSIKGSNSTCQTPPSNYLLQTKSTAASTTLSSSSNHTGAPTLPVVVASSTATTATAAARAGHNLNNNNNNVILSNGHLQQLVKDVSSVDGPDQQQQQRRLIESRAGDHLQYQQQQQQQHFHQQYPPSPLLSGGGTEVLLGDQNLRLDNRSRRRSNTSTVLLAGDEDDHERYLESLLLTSTDKAATIDAHYRNQLQQQQQQAQVHPHHHHHLTSDIEMLTMLSLNQDKGPHREMAVDVPESFIARNKTPPRYPPPPKPMQNTSSKLIPTLSTQPHPPQQQKPQPQVHNSHKTIVPRSHQQRAEDSLIDDKTSLMNKRNLITSNDTDNGHSSSMSEKSKSKNERHILSPNHSISATSSESSLSMGGGGGQNDVDTATSSSSYSLFMAPSGGDGGEAPPKYKSKEDMLRCSYGNGEVLILNDDDDDHHHHHHDLGPHRELPVDVPDNFAELIKAPRYPKSSTAVPQLRSFKPQKPAAFDNGGANQETSFSHPAPELLPSSNTTPHHHLANDKNNNFHNSINNICINHHNSSGKMLPQPQSIARHELNGGSTKPVPPPRDHLRIDKAAPQLPDRKYSGQIAQVVEPTPEQLDSIKKFKEQLQRRKEEDDRIAQQNEFLRASLRGSRKLQALQDGPPALPDRPVVGMENNGYLDDEELDRIMGYGDLVAALQRLQNHLKNNGLHTMAGRVTAAQSLLLGPGVARALATRTAVLQRRRPRTANPDILNAQVLAKDCVETLTQSNSASAIELCDLLSTYEMEGLLQAHDRIATITDRTPSAIAPPAIPMPMKLLNSNPIMLTNSSSIPTNSSSSSNNNSTLNNNNNVAPNIVGQPIGVLRDGGGQDHIRIIQIEKSSEPLGATIKNERDAVVVGRIVRGGAAERSGLLHEGDEILEVNGTEMRGKNINDVCLLLGQMTGTLTFLIVPASSTASGSSNMGRDPAVLHVRAHFDYDPVDDDYIPCRELGISFQKGDVLIVISREDPNWWQAYREGEQDQTLAGLIPSQSYQHQRESIKLAHAGETRRNKDAATVKGATLLCARKGKKKKKKASSEAGYPLYATTTSDDPEPEEILTYEEVSMYYPRASHKRPIVLIGPPNIGRHELRQRLMADSDRFAAAVPHTSRPRREGEVPGQDYHFISRPQFEADILARKFVEHGEYEKAYYGTSLEAIRAVVAIGKICVLNLHPQSLKLLRSSDLKPYVVLVAPPSLEKLRLKKIRSGETFKEEELKDIIATARDMEARWGHLFDMIIINNETERAYHQLLTEINSLEREPGWVPTSWIHK